METELLNQMPYKCKTVGIGFSSTRKQFDYTRVNKSQVRNVNETNFTMTVLKFRLFCPSPKRFDMIMSLVHDCQMIEN